ncbi:MAG: metallophosphoesterase [Clostridia bacterium]|nr:metallophosphoesterase [Clostridia bacterium]
MKYYVIADPHSFYDEMIEALDEKGYFDDSNPHKLIICGDIFDRGRQADKMQEFVSGLIDKDEVILIKGNHEDLALTLAGNFHHYAENGLNWSHHYTNGTVDTFSQLTNLHINEMERKPGYCVTKMKNTDYFKKIIPAMKNFFETEHYIFVHGWIPCTALGTHGYIRDYIYKEDWRELDEEEWKLARWYNGMLAASRGVLEEGKTIVCGHYHTSWGHAYLEGVGSEFGEDSDFKPYYGTGIIALDGCTAYSHIVNCIVIEDTPVSHNI